MRLTANCDHTTTRAYCCFVFGDVIDEDADGDGDGPSGSSHFFGPVGSFHPLSLPMLMRSFPTIALTASRRVDLLN